MVYLKVAMTVDSKRPLYKENNFFSLELYEEMNANRTYCGDQFAINVSCHYAVHFKPVQS